MCRNAAAADGAIWKPCQCSGIWISYNNNETNTQRARERTIEANTELRWARPIERWRACVRAKEKCEPMNWVWASEKSAGNGTTAQLPHSQQYIDAEKNIDENLYSIHDAFQYITTLPYIQSRLLSCVRDAIYIVAYGRGTRFFFIALSLTRLVKLETRRRYVHDSLSGSLRCAPVRSPLLWFPDTERGFAIKIAVCNTDMVDYWRSMSMFLLLVLCGIRCRFFPSRLVRNLMTVVVCFDVWLPQNRWRQPFAPASHNFQPGADCIAYCFNYITSLSVLVARNSDWRSRIDLLIW